METNSGDENSNDGLQIVENPKPKKRCRKELDDSDKRIIESVEKDIEDDLEEKAAKANLTAKKNFIQEVVINEHVMALVRQAENPDESKANNNCMVKSEKAEDSNVVSDVENDHIRKCQIAILAQQMRQHVQMLTQNFMLAYKHPEYASQAEEYKNMLNDIVSGTEGKDASIYHATNLQPAIKLIEHWEKLYSSQDKEVIECKRYVEKVLYESKNAKLAGKEYIVTFPQLLMKTIANSEVFLYPDLLPRIPFRSFQVTKTAYKFFTNGEDNLIALFLEQVIPVLKHDSFYLTCKKKIDMIKICELLSVLLMPDITPEKLVNHIQRRRHPKRAENPIKYFYRTKKALPIVHNVTSVDAQDMLPPCKRNPKLLPFQWREYIYPNKKNELVIDTATAEDVRELSETEVTDLETLTPDDLEIQRQNEESAMLDKLRQTLNVEEYNKLIEILVLYVQNNGEFLELFKNVQSVLYPKYEKLYEEFFLVKDLDGLIRKLIVYLKDQPTPMKTILKELADDLEESFETVTIKTEPTTDFDVSKELGIRLVGNTCASGVEVCYESESDKSKRKIKTSPNTKHSSPKKVKVSRTVKKITEHKPGSSPGQQKQPAEEPKVEYPEPAEWVDLKLHTEEMIKCEDESVESSQDITNFSLSVPAKIEDQEDVPWSIEEDKIMFQVVRQICENEENFKHMAEMLQNRSIPEIKNRFNTLMLLLEQMTAAQRLQST